MPLIPDQEYMVYIQIIGETSTKRFKLRVTANSPDDAKQQVMDSIEIVKVQKFDAAVNDDPVNYLKNMFGMK